MPVSVNAWRWASLQGFPVSDYQRALTWYGRLLGGPAFFPNARGADWELAEHQYFYIEELYQGHSRQR